MVCVFVCLTHIHVCPDLIGGKIENSGRPVSRRSPKCVGARPLETEIMRALCAGSI